MVSQRWKAEGGGAIAGRRTTRGDEERDRERGREGETERVEGYVV